MNIPVDHPQHTHPSHSPPCAVNNEYKGSDPSILSLLSLQKSYTLNIQLLKDPESTAQQQNVLKDVCEETYGKVKRMVRELGSEGERGKWGGGG